MQAAILASPGRSLLKGTPELPSSRLKGEGVIFIYPPRLSPLVYVVCVSRFNMLLAPVNVIPTDMLREDLISLSVSESTNASIDIWIKAPRPLLVQS